MALSFVNVSATAPAGAVTTLTATVPAGTTNGHLMLWQLSSQLVTQPPTPAGWGVWRAVLSAGTNHGSTIFFRIASSEPASYSPTLTSSKWSSILAVYAGQDTTASDATPTTVIGVAGTINAAAITTVTAGAFVTAGGSGVTTSGVINTAWTDSAGNLRATHTQTAAAATNIHAGWSDQVKATAGSYDPNLTFTPTGGVRAAAITSAIRPAAVAAPALVRPLRLVQQAVNRAGNF